MFTRMKLRLHKVFTMIVTNVHIMDSTYITFRMRRSPYFFRHSRREIYTIHLLTDI